MTVQEFSESDRGSSKVVWIASDPVAPSIQSWVVLDATAEDGIHLGDQFALVLGGPSGSIDRGRVAAIVAPFRPLSVEERDEVAA